MGRLVLKHAGPEIDAMKAIAEASRKRSMADFQAVCVMYISLFFAPPFPNALYYSISYV